MAWYASGGANQVYACENCTEELQKARNCENKYPENEFRFQTMQLKKKDDVAEGFIKECPTGYITQVSRLFWERYQHQKIKNELGIATFGIKALQFKAFTVFAHAIQDYDDNKSKKNKRKGGNKERVGAKSPGVKGKRIG